MEGADRAREEFFSEAQEIVEGLGRDLLALDEALRAGRSEPELVNDVFRAVHTLKGLAGLFGAAASPRSPTSWRSCSTPAPRQGRADDVRARSALPVGRAVRPPPAGRDREGREGGVPEVEELVRELHRRTEAGAPLSPIGQYELDPGLLAVLTEYEEHRLRTNIAQGLGSTACASSSSSPPSIRPWTT
jgi:two-component system chemotaxis sensor kinase CheA